MKKIIFLLLAICVFSISANADIICMKKNVAVNKSGNINLSKQFQTVKRNTCPKGYVKLINTDELKGVQGPTGPQGVKGEKGDTGAQGPRGEKGEKGTTGAQGVQGPKGDTGATGATGAQGPKGDSCIEDGYLPSDTTITGIIGNFIEGEKFVTFISPAHHEFQIGGEQECEGSVDNPTAKPGYLCIYNVYGNVVAEKIEYNSSQEECVNNGYDYREYCADPKIPYMEYNEYNTKEDCETSKGTVVFDDDLGYGHCGTREDYYNETDCTAHNFKWVDMMGCFDTSNPYSILECSELRGVWVGRCIDTNTTQEIHKYLNSGFKAVGAYGSLAVWALHTSQD